MDVVALYQWVLQTELERREVWLARGVLLQRLLRRNMAILAADLNSACRPLPGQVGRAWIGSKAVNEELIHDRGFAGGHGLCQHR